MLEREHTIPLDDGVIITEVDRGDGSTGPFIHMEVENPDADNCKVNLTWRECVQLAGHLLDRATQISKEAEANEDPDFRVMMGLKLAQEEQP